MTILVPGAPRLVGIDVPLVCGRMDRLLFELGFPKSLLSSHHLNLLVLAVSAFLSFV